MVEVDSDQELFSEVNSDIGMRKKGAPPPTKVLEILMLII
jgi:hypothetical protein